MEGMRKFYVTYNEYRFCGEYEFYDIVITLNKGEKANLSTFENKLNEIMLSGCLRKIMSWSLIEE